MNNNNNNNNKDDDDDENRYKRLNKQLNYLQKLSSCYLLFGFIATKAS